VEWMEGSGRPVWRSLWGFHRHCEAVLSLAWGVGRRGSYGAPQDVHRVCAIAGSALFPHWLEPALRALGCWWLFWELKGGA
jgi:hypothetical protein